jgi:ATPase family associated with various cellular activities (AAA)
MITFQAWPFRACNTIYDHVCLRPVSIVCVAPFSCAHIHQLLACMDGLDTNNNGVIVVAATNRFDMLDDALTRPGRFDRIVRVGVPEEAGRQVCAICFTCVVALTSTYALLNLTSQYTLVVSVCCHPSACWHQLQRLPLSQFTCLVGLHAACTDPTTPKLYVTHLLSCRQS